MKAIRIIAFFLVISFSFCFVLYQNKKAIIKPVNYECLISDNIAKAAFYTNEAEVFAVKIAPGEVTYAEENEYGKELYQKLLNENNFITSGLRKERLDEILRKLLSILPDSKTDLEYYIYCIDDNEINAFTAGGYIFVNKGIIDYCDTDDELAFVIAHEIGHNELGHLNLILKRIKLAGDFANIAYTIKNLTSSSFNQFNELEADCYAADIVTAASYNPNYGAEFWKKMATDNDEGNDKLTKFFRTHPYSIDRYNCLIKHLSEN